MNISAGSATRRFGVITVDQALSGGSNILITVCAARLLTVEAFGLFGIVFLTYVAAMGLIRSLVCNPVLIHPADAEQRPQLVCGSLMAVALAVAGCIGLVSLATWPWSHQLGAGLAVLAVGLPALALQDLGRYLAIAVHRPARALWLDLGWLVLAGLSVATLFGLGVHSMYVFVAAWTGSGVVAGSVVAVRYRWGALRPDLRWIRGSWSFSSRYLVVFVASQGGALLAAAIVAAIGGVRTLGAIRGAVLFVSPFATVQAAALAAGVAEVSRDPVHVADHARRTTVLITAFSVVNLAVLAFFPDVVGAFVLGDTWTVARPLLVPAGLQAMLLAAITGIQAGLMGTRFIGLATRLNLVAAAITLVAVAVGVAIGGAVGMSWALVVEQAVVDVIWVIAYLHRHQNGRAPSSGAQDVVPEPGGPTEVMS